MGIPITQLIPEIQLRVNSNPERYDLNSNGQIDDGDELSALLSEYGRSKEYLTKYYEFEFSSVKTVEEKAEIKDRQWDEYARGFTRKLFTGIEMAGALGGVASIVVGCVLGSELAPIGLAVLGGSLVAHLIHKGVAKHSAFNEIKAEQASRADNIRQEKYAKEEEMRQREAALKQKELEYQQNMDTATKNIEQQVSTAQRRARQLNAELKEAQAQIDSLTAK